ncbi:MAG: serine/threonine protein kinase [Rubrivivax sp.]
MPSTNPLPAAYGRLTPDTVLEALDAVGLRGDGRILQLNSYENRVFRLMLEDGGAAVAKFYRPGRWSDDQILEEHGFTLELAAAEVAVMAPLRLHLLPGATNGARIAGPGATLLHWQPRDGGAHRISVSPWLGGRDPDVESPQAFERLGRLIGRVHAVGATQPFAHRLTLCPALGLQAIDTLVELQAMDPGQANPWESAARTAMEGVARAFERSDSAALRLHGDAHRGNLLEREQTLHLVDFDDACNGPAMQDLWLFLDGHDGEGRHRQLQALLRGYEDFMPFDDAQLALIEPLRTLRMLRHSAWVAQRWADPAFPIAFPGFGTPNHWADQTALLNEQIDRMG